MRPRRTPAPPPRHLGIILDGNRRWARAKGLPDPTDGHRTGFARIPQVLTWCEQAGIGHVTLWMLSTENLQRSPQEIQVVMEVISSTLLRLTFQDRWTIRHIGITDGLTPTVVHMLALAQQETAGPGRVMTVNVAVGYGGRREIADAAKAVVARMVREDGLSVSEAAEQLTGDHISAEISAGQPPPDLIIRTSGEHRTSGFLLWTGTEANWWITPTLWPGFSRRHLRRALAHHRKAQLA